MLYVRLLHEWKKEYNYPSKTTIYDHDTAMLLK